MATRIESDSMGEIEVDDARLWGAQTERSRRLFQIGDERMPRDLIIALATIKKAAALVNRELGALEPRACELIAAAADEVIAGRHDGEFPLVVWQTGSGTQTNMNVNEVIANLANELAGGRRGARSPIHPNDHVNRSHSSNDAFPTAIHLAALARIEDELVPALAGLRATLDAKAAAYAGVIKVGRTHLQDATPITLGQEMSGWVAQLDDARAAIAGALPGLRRLALGGTAVGTGLTAPRGFAERVAVELSRLTGRGLVTAPNKFAALAGHEALVCVHGAIKLLATALFKIANDVRWLASGPRCGLGELRIPENEPGSSIMPGKVNPTQCEAMTMVCVQVFGNDTAVTFAAASGNFELNVFKPLLGHAVLQSVRLLAGACRSFDANCAVGIVADRDEIARKLERSLMLVTALSPHVGYDRAAQIAHDAHARGVTLREAAGAAGVTAEQFEAWVRPEEMV
jgi:fumarate hydratase class II